MEKLNVLRATVQTRAFLLQAPCFLSTCSTISWERMREQCCGYSYQSLLIMCDHWQILKYFYSARKIYKHKESNTVCFSSFSSQIENGMKTCMHAQMGGTSASWAHVTPSQPSLDFSHNFHYTDHIQFPVRAGVSLCFSVWDPPKSWKDIKSQLTHVLYVLYVFTCLCSATTATHPLKNSKFWDNCLPLQPKESQGVPF